MKLLLLFLSLTFILNADIKTIEALYAEKKYEAVISEVKKSVKDYSNPQLHLLWAKSAEALGHYDEAMSAYERVEILDENNLEARVALAKIYKKTHRDALATEQVKALQNYQLSPQERSSLDAIRETSDLHSFKAYADVSFGYDSNIDIAPVELSINNPVKEIATGFTRVLGSVSYINEIEEKGGWYARGDLQVYNQSNMEDDAKLYDLFLGAISAGIGYTKNGLNLYVPIGYDTVHYLNKDLLSQIKIKPTLNYSISHDFIANFNLSYVQRTYTQTQDALRDDTAYGLGAGAYYLFGRNFVYLNAKYENFSKQNINTALFVDKSYLTTNMGINYNLTPHIVTRLDYRLRLASFGDIGSAGEKRSDTYNQVEVKISHYFAQNFEVFLEDRYIDNSSNISVLSYKKNIMLLGISANY